MQIAAINKLNLSEFCERKKIRRRIQKFPSLLLQKFIFQKYDFFYLQNNEIIDAYVDQYYEYNELADDISEFSQNIETVLPKEQIQHDNMQNLQINENEIKNNNSSSLDFRPVSVSVGGAQHTNIEEQLKNFTQQFSQTFSRQQSFNNQLNRNQSKEFKSVLNSNLYIPSDLENTDQNIKAQKQIIRPLALIVPQNTSTSPKQGTNAITGSKMSNKEKNNAQNQKGNAQSPLLTSNSSSKQKSQLPVNSSTNNMNYNNQLYFFQHTNIDESCKMDKSFMQNSKMRIQNNHISNNNNHQNLGTEINNNQKLNDLIYQIVQTYAQKDYKVQGQQNQDEEFEIQKNYDFYLPHNNLSVILEYLKFKQKNIKSMKISFRNSSHYIRSQRFLHIPNQRNSSISVENKDFAKNNSSFQTKSIMCNSKSHHLFRQFQQQKVKLIESKQRKKAILLKKRKSSKAATTKIQKLILKYEQISNGSANTNIDNQLTTQVNQKNTIPETSMIENINDSNNREVQKNQNYLGKRMSVFSQLAPIQKSLNGIDEIKDLQSPENLFGQETNFQNQNFIKLPTLQNYVQNKIRFSILSNRKSFLSQTIQSLNQQQSTQNPYQIQESFKQACVNEDISSSSSESENTPRHNIKDNKIFQQNLQHINSSQFIVYSPHNSDYSYSQNQLQLQKNNESCSYFSSAVKDLSKVQIFLNDY